MKSFVIIKMYTQIPFYERNVKMAIGFRKSLFGFNCDDVVNYVKKLHNNFTEKENDFKKEIEELNRKIEILSLETAKLAEEKAAVEAELKEYDLKKAEMERLSENIGKLYLVAQTNAKTIMHNAEENSRLANDEVAKNIVVIDGTHEALEALRKSITETSENFTREVESLIESLNETKEKICADCEIEINAKNEFSEIYEKLTK